MIYYIDEIIAAFYKTDPRGHRIKTRAAPEHLYKSDDSCEKLSTNTAKMIYNIVTKTLYTTNREIPDTCTAVAFLKKIVRENNKYDWGKLINLMKYIRGMRDITLVLSDNGSGFLKW